MARREARAGRRGHHHREVARFGGWTARRGNAAASGGCAARGRAGAALRGLDVAGHEHEVERAQRRASVRLSASGWSAAQQHHVALVEQMLALRAAQGRQVAEGESRCGLPRAPRRWRRGGSAAPRRTPGACAAGKPSAAAELLGADVAHVHDEAALRARRVEAVSLVDRQLERLERRLDLAREALGFAVAPTPPAARMNSGSCKASQGASAWLTAGCRDQRVGGGSRCPAAKPAWKT